LQLADIKSEVTTSNVRSRVLSRIFFRDSRSEIRVREDFRETRSETREISRQSRNCPRNETASHLHCTSSYCWILEILCCYPKGRRALLRVPSTEGRGVCLCWALSKPKGPKLKEKRVRARTMYEPRTSTRFLQLSPCTRYELIKKKLEQMGKGRALEPFPREDKRA